MRMTGGAGVLVVAVSPCVDRYAWFDRFELGIPNRPQRVEVQPGGKAMNAARVLRALGVPVAVVAPLDLVDRGWWEAELARDRMRLTASPATGTARMTFTCIDEGAAVATEMYEPSTPLAPAEWAALEQVVSAAVRRERPLGVVLAGSRPGDDGGALARVVGTCREAGVPVYVDGYGPPVAGAIRARPTVLKVNLEEARRILGSPMAGAETAARGLVELGPEISVVTLGADGALAFDGRRTHRVPPPAARAAYPGGSGDAFMAGLVAAHATGQALEVALEQARACAEANATSPYAGWIPPAPAPGDGERT